MNVCAITQTKTDVGVQCQHDMRPSVQLPGVSGIESKLTVVSFRLSVTMILIFKNYLLRNKTKVITQIIKQFFDLFVTCYYYLLFLKQFIFIFLYFLLSVVVLLLLLCCFLNQLNSEIVRTINDAKLVSYTGSRVCSRCTPSKTLSVKLF